jgi:uncharacterized cupin superfamily protein
MICPRQRIRIECDLASPGSFTDLEGSKTPSFARASDVQIELLCKSGGEILTISNFSTITLRIKATRTGASLITKTLNAGDLDTTITEASHASWDDATGQHGLFALTAADTALTVTGNQTEYFVSIVATTTADPSAIVQIGYGSIFVVETGIGGADTPTPAPPTSYTKAEVDALIAGCLQLVAPAGKTITLVHPTNGKAVVLGVDDTGEFKVTTIAP